MVNEHFFKPLLPNFHTHLTIPTAFYSKYMQGRNEHKTVKLRSDASNRTWEVKIEDALKLTDGWKEFTRAHDLRTGDILIFRQEEEDMSFHVTLLGPSCCEIQYKSEKNNLEKIQRMKKEKRKKKNPRRHAKSSSLDPSLFVSNVLASSLRWDTLCLPMRFVRENGIETGCGEIVLMNEEGSSWTLALKQKQSGIIYIRRGWRRFCRANRLNVGASFTFKLIQGGRTVALRLLTTKSKEETNSPSLDTSSFVAHVSASTLLYDSLYLSRSFVRENGLERRCGEIVLMNEKGRLWKLVLKQKEACGTMYITRGWRSFCSDNGLRAGSFITFKLVQRGRTLALRLSSQESDSDDVESVSTDQESDKARKIQREKNANRETKPSSLDPSCFVAYVSPATLRNDNLNLPRGFARENGLNKRRGEIVLVNQKGRSWTLDMNGKTSYGNTYIRNGWRSFCSANGLKAGSFITFKLVQRGGTLALHLSSTESKEEGDEIESLSTESESDEERSFKKVRSSRWKASSSSSQNRFVTLTLKDYFIRKCIMYLPLPFTKINGINEETKMTLLDKNGKKWSTKLRCEGKGERIRMVGGWKDFFKANCVKIGESVVLEMIWEGDIRCVLKFCSKVKQETR